MIIYKKNLNHVQNLQKQAHDKAIISKSYTLNKKIQFNNKYIKTKHNCKLETKFFGLFQVFYLVGN